jgi:hypothetical protein
MKQTKKRKLEAGRVSFAFDCRLEVLFVLLTHLSRSDTLVESAETHSQCHKKSVGKKLHCSKKK